MTTSPVESYNEWDPLEEVIVGVAKGAVRSAFEPASAPYVPLGSPDRAFGGDRYSDDELSAAQRQLDGLAERLAKEGVVVRRPEPLDQGVAYQTPDFAVPMGHAQVCPRDVLLVVGDEIIEAPMAKRCRYFEYRAYRPLVREYFNAGARWTQAPKPLMNDDLYTSDYSTEERGYDIAEHPNLTELEPCFDAASLVRFGRDIFWQPDIVSNRVGIEWLRRHLGPTYRIHKMEFRDRIPEHADTTFVPLREGLVVTNPERPARDATIECFKANGWRAVDGPPSVRDDMPFPARDVSNWISLNFLSLDPNTVIAEAEEKPLHAFLRSLGCEVIPIEFRAVYQFGGSFHCCTTDVRRRGKLKSYFPLWDITP